MVRIVLPLALLLAACAGPSARPSALPPPPLPSGGLEGTGWQLLAFQSMDDAKGTTRSQDPARTTVSFGSDGRASFQLDCNRGSGTFTDEPSADGRSGQLRFGPVATTRMACAEQGLGDQLGRHLDYVRSYVLKDGRLFMALMADGGIYEWEPIPQER